MKTYDIQFVPDNGRICREADWFGFKVCKKPANCLYRYFYYCLKHAQQIRREVDGV